MNNKINIKVRNASNVPVQLELKVHSEKSTAIFSRKIDQKTKEQRGGGIFEKTVKISPYGCEIRMEINGNEGDSIFVKRTVEFNRNLESCSKDPERSGPFLWDWRDYYDKSDILNCSFTVMYEPNDDFLT